MSEPVRDIAIRDIVVVGGGLAGWYCAARLCHAMRGRRISVKVVHAAPAGAEVDPLDVFCASTLPALAVTHAALGIDERTFMRECHAAFKLATEFRGFAAPGRSYMLPLGEIGARLEAVGFHQYLSRLMRAGRTLDIDEFSVPAIAARLGRFAHPSQDARSVLSTYEYAYHLDTAAYTRLLRAFAERHGAVAVDGELAQVQCEADRHSIAAITLKNGSRIGGDLFVDCSGTRAALLGEALGVAFDSWRQWLPCDQAVSLRTRGADSLAPFTRITAQPAGWAWQVPLRGALTQALVFDSRRRDPQSVLSQVPAQGEALAPAHSLRFTNGRRHELWRGNCVAVGAAAGFLEPLLSTGLRLIDEGVTRLIALFPDRETLPLMAGAYNRALGATYDGARDFAILHYLPAQPPESLPPSLRQRVELFRYRGRVVLHDEELFEEPEWACAFIGLGERPQFHSILTQQMSEDEALAQVAKIARVMHDAAQKLPPHQAYLQRYLA